MNRRLLTILLAAIIAACLTIPASAQLYVPHRSYRPGGQNSGYGNGYSRQQQFDAQLNRQDAQMVMQMSQKYAPDHRYEQFLNRISSKFNYAGSKVFRNYDSKDVRYVVLCGALGFNALALHRSIILDSLLMDVMKFYAMGLAYYGKVDTGYTRALAQKTLFLQSCMQKGQVQPNFKDMDNPFGLPYPGKLDSRQAALAMEYYEEIIASVLAHEGSHAFLEHTKEKMLTQQKLWSEGRATQQQIMQYVNVDMTRAKEFEADKNGVAMLYYSGYSINGMKAWFRFADIMEYYANSLYSPNRTHPTGEERIEAINRTWDSLNAGRIR